MATNDDSFSGLLRGALRDYLDIRAFEEISDIENKPLRQDTQLTIKQDSPTPQVIGMPSVPTIAGLNSLFVIGGALLVVAVAVAVFRR